MGHIRSLSILSLAVLAFGSVSTSVWGATAPRITGMYSSMGKSAEGGDLQGFEAWITPSNEGVMITFQATFEVPSPPVVVPLTVNGDRVSFAIPDQYENAGVYSGTITADGFRGTWVRKTKGGQTETFPVKMKRQQTYWATHP